MASTKLFLDMRGKAADGKGSLLIRIYHNQSSTTIKTGVRVSPDNWTGTKVLCVPGVEAINAKLQKQKSTIDKDIALLSIEDNFDSMTASEIKSIITSKVKDKKQSHYIESIFNDYIDNGNLKDGTKSIYNLTLKKVLDFGGCNLKIENINLKWLRSFNSYLSKNQCANGRAIYLRSLRAICNYALHNNIISIYPFEHFKIKYDETAKRNIPVDLLRKFHDYPASNKNSMYRDYFFLMFFLIGINSKDLLLAKKSQMINGRLEYIREKTNKKYSIKIEPEAKVIIEKYKGENEFLLNALDHCKYYNSFAREINEGLRKIGSVNKSFIPDETNLFSKPKVVNEIKPIIPEITTYYARHSWATIAYELGISSDIISLALGHAPTNRTTFIYIETDPVKVDIANRKVIDYVLYGKR